VLGNPAQRNTPFVQQECDGQITVTDPTHPLFGRNLKLAGMARLPGHVRQCQVEVQPGQYGYVPVASTDLSTEPTRERTLLTVSGIQDLVAIFQALPTVRRTNHATGHKSRRVESSTAKRAKRGD